METKITNKDKRLLSFLICVLIVVGFSMYLIMPTRDRISELDVNIQDAQLAKQEMKLKISMRPDYEEQLASLQQDAAGATGEYYDRLESQEVDRELTNLAIANKLECVSLDIESIAFAVEEPYVRSELARQQEEEEGNDEKIVQEQIYARKIRMVLEGEEENYQRLIDLFVNGYPAIRVTDISYVNRNGKRIVQEDGSVIQGDPYRQLVLTMNIYMTDKSRYEQMEAAAEGTSGTMEVLGQLFSSLLNGAQTAEQTTEQATERVTEQATERVTEQATDITEQAQSETGGE